MKRDIIMKVHRSSCDVHVILATFESQFNYLGKFPSNHKS